MIMSPRVRLHAFVPTSLANGPGKRAVVWVQGCSLGCPGCFNPETHSLEGGEWIGVKELFGRLARLAGCIEGVTVTGGEPLEQCEAITALLCRVRRQTSLTVIVFTGYTWDEVQCMPNARQLLPLVDLLLTGRYRPGMGREARFCGWRGKRLHLLTDRYGATDLKLVPSTEILITSEGNVIVSGIDPADLSV